MDAYSAGDLVSRVGSAASGTAEYAYLMVNFAVGMLTSLGAMLALALLDWQLAAVFMIVVPVTAVITRSLSKQGRATYRSYQDRLGDMAGVLSESLVGSRTIRANHTQEREAERVLSVLPELSRDGHASWGLMAASSWRLGLVGVIGQVTVLLVAIHAVAEGRLQAGDLLAVSGYATLATRFSSQLGPFASAHACSMPELTSLL
jgi:ATP-binding cassette, subfamily B, bacterial